MDPLLPNHDEIEDPLVSAENSLLRDSGMIDSYGLQTDQSIHAAALSPDAEETGLRSSQYHGIWHAMSDSLKATSLRTAEGFASSFGADNARVYLQQIRKSSPDLEMPEQQNLAGWLAYQGINGLVTTLPTVAVGALVPGGVGIGIVRALQGATTFAQLFGDNYNKALSDTGDMADPYTILGASVLNTAIQSGVEIGLGPQRWLSDSLRAGMTRGLTRDAARKTGIMMLSGLMPKMPKMLAGAFEEGAEEVLQLASDDLTGKFLSGKDMSEAGEYLQNFAAGAWGGFVMGAPATILDNVADSRAKKTIDKLGQTAPTQQDLNVIASRHIAPGDAADPVLFSQAQAKFLAQEDGAFAAFAQMLPDSMKPVAAVIRNIAYGMSAADGGIVKPSEYINMLKVAFVDESKLSTAKDPRYPEDLSEMEEFTARMKAASDDAGRVRVLRETFSGFDRMVQSVEQIMKLREMKSFNDRLQKDNIGSVQPMDEATHSAFAVVLGEVATRATGETAPRISRTQLTDMLMRDELSTESLRAIVLNGGIDGVKIGSKTYRAVLNADFSLSFLPSAGPKVAAKDRVVDATFLAALGKQDKGGLRASKTEIEIAQERIRGQELARQREMLDTLDAMDGKMTTDEKLRYQDQQGKIAAEQARIAKRLAAMKAEQEAGKATETPEVQAQRATEIKDFETMALELKKKRAVPVALLPENIQQARQMPNLDGLTFIQTQELAKAAGINVEGLDQPALKAALLTAYQVRKPVPASKEPTAVQAILKPRLRQGFTPQELDAMPEDELRKLAYNAGLQPGQDTPAQIKVRLLSAYPSRQGALYQRKESRLTPDQQKVWDGVGMYLKDSRLAVFYADADVETVLHEWFHHVSTSGLLPSRYENLLHRTWAHDANGNTIVDLKRQYEQNGQTPPSDEELLKRVRWTTVSEENAVRDFLSYIRDAKITDPKLKEVFDVVRGVFRTVYERVGEEYINGPLDQGSLSARRPYQFIRYTGWLDENGKFLGVTGPNDTHEMIARRVLNVESKKAGAIGTEAAYKKGWVRVVPLDERELAVAPQPGQQLTSAQESKVKDMADIGGFNRIVTDTGRAVMQAWDVDQEMRGGFMQEKRTPVTPEQDREYMAAVERGDTETAQRMVDEAAKAAGYNVGPVWHGTGRSFTEFRENMGGRFSVSAGGFWFSKHKDTALSHGPKLIRAFIRNAEPTGDDYIVRDSANIKSADPITRDDQGRVIPLSERFNERSSDIRWERRATIAAELDFGAGSDLAVKYGERWAKATPEQKADMTKEVSDIAAAEVVKASGLKLSAKYDGRGGWTNDGKTGRNPNFTLDVSGNESQIETAMNLMGYSMSQTGIIGLTTGEGPDSSIHIQGAGGSALSREEMAQIHDALSGFPQILGYLEYGHVDGNPRAMVIGIGGMPVEKAHELTDPIADAINKANDKINVEVIARPAISRYSENKWDEEGGKNGTSYLNALGDEGSRGREDAHRIASQVDKATDAALTARLLERRTAGRSRQDVGEDEAKSQKGGPRDAGRFLSYTHYSNQAGLRTLSPNFSGKGGLPGEERNRQRDYKEVYQGRIYVYLGKHTKESGLGSQVYKGRIDEGTLYDGSSDPDNVRSEAYARLLESGEYAPNDDRALYTIAESIIKERGWLGLRYIDNEAILFHPVTPGGDVTTASFGDFRERSQGDRGLQRGQRAGMQDRSARGRAGAGVLQEAAGAEPGGEPIGFSPETEKELAQILKPVGPETLDAIIGNGLYGTMRYRNTFENPIPLDAEVEVVAKAVATGTPIPLKEGGNPLWQKRDEPKGRTDYNAKLHAIFGRGDQALAHGKASDFVKQYVRDNFGREIASMADATDEEMKAATEEAQKKFGIGDMPLTDAYVQHVLPGLTLTAEELKLANPGVYDFLVDRLRANAPQAKKGKMIEDASVEASMLAETQAQMHALRPLRPTVAGGPEILTNMLNAAKRGLQSMVKWTYGLYDMCKFLDDGNEKVMNDPQGRSFTQMVWAKFRDANHAIAAKYMPVEQEYAAKVNSGEFYKNGNKVFSLPNGERYSYNEMLVIYSLAGGEMVNVENLEITTKTGKRKLRPEYRNLASWLYSNIGTGNAEVSKGIQTANQIVNFINSDPEIRRMALNEINWQQAIGNKFFDEASRVYFEWTGRKMDPIAKMYTPLVRQSGDIHEADLASVFENVEGYQPTSDSLDSLKELHHRKGGKGGAIRMDYRGNFLRHIEAMNNYTEKRGLVAQTLAMLGNDQLTDVIRRRFGTDDIILNGFKMLVEREMKPSGQWTDMAFGNKLAGRVMQNVYASVFPWNIMTIPTQLTSLSNGLAELGLSPSAMAAVTRHLGNIASHVTRNIQRAKAGEVAHILEGNEIYEQVKRLSPALLRRFPIAEAETYRRNQSFLAKHVPGWSRMIEDGNLFMELGDMGAVLPTWKAIFDENVAKMKYEHLDWTPQKIEKAAADAAYDAVVQSQNPSTVTEKSLMQTGPGIVRAIIPFSGQTFVLWHNLMNDVAVPLIHAIQDNETIGGKAAGISRAVLNKQFLSRYAGRFLIPAVLMGMVARRRPPKDIEEVLKDIAVYPLTSVPIVGNMIWSSMFLGWNDGGPVAFWESLAKDSLKLAKKGFTLQLTEKDLNDMARTGALATGVPQAFVRMINTAVDVASHDDKRFDWEAVRKSLGMQPRG